MTEKYKKRIESFCQRRGYSYEWQSLKFGFQRAVLIFQDSKTYTEAQSEVYKIPETHASWNCCYQGEFEGRIYLMYDPDYKALSDRLDAEKAANEEWWRRYHHANEEIRKKMASGEIP